MVQGKEVTYNNDGEILKGYIAYDDAIKGKRPGVLVVHEWWIIDSHQIAVDPEHRRIVCREVEVGGLLFRHELKECVDPGHAALPKKAKLMPAVAIS